MLIVVCCHSECCVSSELEFEAAGGSVVIIVQWVLSCCNMTCMGTLSRDYGIAYNEAICLTVYWYMPLMENWVTNQSYKYLCSRS